MKDEDIKEIISFWVSAGIWTYKILENYFPNINGSTVVTLQTSVVQFSLIIH